jgi:hypothetical protein
MTAVNSQMRPEKYIRQICFDLLRFNQESFFTLSLGSARLVLGLGLETPEVKPPSAFVLTHFLEDIQQRVRTFNDDLADRLKIVPQVPFSHDLSFNQIPAGGSARENLLAIALRQAFKIDKENKGLENLVDAFINELDQADLLREGRLFSSGRGSLFEGLIRVAVFSPFKQDEIVKMLFRIIISLDLNPSVKKVKLSHVEFLIWYIFRLSLNYLSLLEVRFTVRSLLQRAENYVESATIMNLDKRSSLSLNVTELFRIWLLATRKRTGQNVILLGSEGVLNNLKEALDFWIEEHMDKNFKLTRSNELKVIMRCGEKSVPWELRFDDQFKVILPYGDPETKLEGKHLILAEDSEILIDEEAFRTVINTYPILGDVMNRMHHIGSAAWNVDLKVGGSGHGVDELHLKVKCAFVVEPNNQKEGIVLGRVDFVATSSSDLPPRIDQAKIDGLLASMSKFLFSKTVTPYCMVRIAGLSQKSLKSLMNYGLQRLKQELVESGNKLDYGSLYKYKEASLALLRASGESAKILVTYNDDVKMVKTQEITADEAYNFLGMNKLENPSQPSENPMRVLELRIVLDDRPLRLAAFGIDRLLGDVGNDTEPRDQFDQDLMNESNNLFGDALFDNLTGSPN